MSTCCKHVLRMENGKLANVGSHNDEITSKQATKHQPQTHVNKQQQDTAQANRTLSCGWPPPKAQLGSSPESALSGLIALALCPCSLLPLHWLVSYGLPELSA